MEWTHEQTVKLIEEFEKQECLWNMSLKEYKNMVKKKDAWETLAKYFSTNTMEVEKKMKSLLSAYRRERKKILDSRNLGNGIDDIYEPKWFGYKYLQFLKTVNKQREMRKTLKLKKSHNNEMESINVENGETEYVENISNNLTNDTEVFDAPYEGTKRKRTISQTEQTEPVQEVPKKRLETKKDECSIYGELIAHQLRRLPTDYERTVVQFKMQELLFQATMGAFKKISEGSSVSFECEGSSSSMDFKNL